MSDAGKSTTNESRRKGEVLWCKRSIKGVGETKNILFWHV